MLRVAYCSDGSSAVYDRFFLNFLRNQYDVHLVTFNINPIKVNGVTIVKIYEPLGLLFKHLPPRIQGTLKRFLVFLRALLFKYYLHMLKPDLVIGNWATTYGFYSAFSRYDPFVLFIWGSDVLVEPKHLFLRSLVKYTLKIAKAVVVDSDIQRNTVIKLGCEKDKIIKFPWVDLSPFLDEVIERDNFREVREEMGWKDNPIIISTRNHEPIYGVEFLIEAIPKIIQESPEARFLVLGSGSLTNKLKQKVKRLKIEKYVAFLGRVPHHSIVRYLKISDIYVSTSFSDGTSASLLEAMACKLPSVVTDIHGNSEWIDDKRNGFLFSPRDYESLAQKILLLINNKYLRRSLGIKAYESVTKRANWRENQMLLTKLIEELVKRN